MASSGAAAPSPDRSSRLERFVASPRRAVWTMALPMMGGMAMHTLYMVVDFAFIGTLSTDALSAATFVWPLFFVIMALTMGLAIGVTALVAQAVGRRDAADGDLVAGNALGVGVVIGFAFLAVGIGWGHDILDLLGASGRTEVLAWQYFQAIALGAPLFFVTAVLRSVLNGEGDARTPMIVMTMATIINIGLDALFIFGFGWGIRGAALATVGSQVVVFSAFVWFVARRRQAWVRFRVAGLRPRAGLLKRLAVLAVPAAANMLVMAVGAGLVNRVLTHFGQVSVAAYGAATRVDMIVRIPVFGVAAATVAVIGMFAGAGRADLIRSVALYAYRWGITFAVTIGLVAYLTSGWVLQLFTRDPEALAIGRVYLAFMILGYPMMAFGMQSGRILQGLGYGLPALIITSVRVLLIAIPFAYAAVYLFDQPIHLVWLGVLVGSACSNVLALLWVRRNLWRRDPTARARAAAPRAVEEAPGDPVEPSLTA